MRTFRRFAVGAALIALLGMNGASAGAFHSSSGDITVAPSPVQTTGWADFDGWPLLGGAPDGVLTDLDRGSIVGHADGTDPRISGSWSISWEYNGVPGAELSPVSGFARLETAEGAWVGTMFEGGFCSRGWFTGEGAYEGLTYYMQGVTEDGHVKTEGIIYQGS